MPDLTSLGEQAPVLVVLLLIVSMFLAFMRRRDEAHGKDLARRDEAHRQELDKFLKALDTQWDYIKESGDENRRLQVRSVEVIAENTEVLRQAKSGMLEAAEMMRASRR